MFLSYSTKWFEKKEMAFQWTATSTENTGLILDFLYRNLSSWSLSTSSLSIFFSSLLSTKLRTKPTYVEETTRRDKYLAKTRGWAILYVYFIITHYIVTSWFTLLWGMMLFSLLIGKLNANVAPLPSVLFSAHILPPWASTIPLEI